MEGSILPESENLMEEAVGCGGSGLASLHSRGVLSFMVTGDWVHWQGRGQSLQSQQEPKMSRCPNYRKCKGMINKLIKHNTLGKNNKNNDRSYCLQSFFLF